MLMANLLPLDVIFEILLRIPLKSLIQFKCVFKSWRALIESSDFVKYYHQNSLETNCNPSLVFTFKQSEKSDLKLGRFMWIYRMSGLHEFSQGSAPTKLYLPPPLIEDQFLEVVGSSNGLICVRNPGCLALINPTTRVLKFVPYWERKDIEWNGFGYDSEGDDYKIVAVTRWGFVVYSLKTGLWGRHRFLGEFPSPSVDEVNGFLLNGHLHWISSCKNLVLTFDVHNEKWGELSLPNCDYGVDLWWVDLGVFDGCLCVIFSIVPDCSHVWIMKEYGIKETWKELFSLPFVKAMPLASTKRRCEVMFSRGFSQDLFIWNTEEKTLKEIEAPINHYSQVTAYEDSVAPLGHFSFMLRSEETKKKKRTLIEGDLQQKQERIKKKQRTMNALSVHCLCSLLWWCLNFKAGQFLSNPYFAWRYDVIRNGMEFDS